MASWNKFNRDITRLNAREALFAACALEKVVYALHNRSFPPKRVPTQNLPELLYNYACNLNPETKRKFDIEKVKHVVDMILNTRLTQADQYAEKLASRVEFQFFGIENAMPTTINEMFDMALIDAEDGNTRGIAWACFQLKQAFQNSVTSAIDQEEALELYSGLRDVPELLLDMYGEAGFDVALRMEKMLSKIGDMPSIPVPADYSEMRPN